jgi:hypothetical protein
MATTFYRHIGAQPGIQQNPLKDTSELPSFGNQDQTFAVAARFPRGRIDKPFRVNRSTAARKLGRPEPMRSSQLNESHVQVVEALNNGSFEAVVMRLSTASAVLNWIVVNHDGTATTAAELPTTKTHLFAVKHLECHNDGIRVSFHADAISESGSNVANQTITVQLIDSTGILLHEFTGSLDPAATDDFGNTFYLPNVVSSQLADGEVEISVPDDASVSPDSDAYGKTESGSTSWITTPVISYFVEGGIGYVTDDFVKARNLLKSTDLDYGYIVSGGSRSAALITQMVLLAFDVNRQFKYDVPGDLTPDAAIDFVNQLNITDKNYVHLVHAFWAPLKTDCPSGINGKAVIGTSALNVAKACSRNASTNAKGFAPKNYPIAGESFPFDRSGVQQLYAPSEQELSDLALAGINPVLYERYSSGGKYVWTDSLTSRTGNSLAKLIAVADMSTDLDDKITRYMKGLVQFPMNEACKKANDFLKTLLVGADASGWLVPSSKLGGRSFQYLAQPNEARPYDRMDVKVWTSFDGTVRQIMQTQEIVGR